MGIPAQILANLRASQPSFVDCTVTAALHDRCWWDMIWTARGDLVWQTQVSKSTAEEALLLMLEYSAVWVWDKAKKDGITLSK